MVRGRGVITFWQSVGITDFSTPDISHLPVRSPISQDLGNDIGDLGRYRW
jgi:hypothetical protein